MIAELLPLMVSLLAQSVIADMPTASASPAQVAMSARPSILPALQPPVATPPLDLTPNRFAASE